MQCWHTLHPSWPTAVITLHTRLMQHIGQQQRTLVQLGCIAGIPHTSHQPRTSLQSAAKTFSAIKFLASTTTVKKLQTRDKRLFSVRASSPLNCTQCGQRNTIHLLLLTVTPLYVTAQMILEIAVKIIIHRRLLSLDILCQTSLLHQQCERGWGTEVLLIDTRDRLPSHPKQRWGSSVWCTDGQLG